MEERICYGCMKKKTEEGTCPYCGCGDDIQNEEHQLPVGTVLKEQYLVGRVLGQGGFGITYIGWDRYLDTRVAIKEYYPAGVVSRSSHTSTDVISGSGEIGVRFRNNKERFLREAKMLARLSDIPEIVQVKTFFLANNTAYIVMEYVEGTTLKEYVMQQGGRISAPEAMQLLTSVMLALEKVHRAGVVHRDISPENIMIQENGTVKLLDFGAVRDVGEMTPGKPLDRSTEAILKQGYAPVEQYQSRGALGAWTDVYAMCGTLYYCLTGKVPSDAPGRLLGEEIAWPTELGVKITPKFEETLKQGMAIMTAERIQSMSELCERLTTALYDEAPDPEPEPGPDPAPTPDPAPKPVPAPDTGRIGWIAAIAVLLAVIAGVAAWSWLQNRPEVPGTETVTEKKDEQSENAAGAGETAAQEESDTEAASSETQDTALLSGQCGDHVFYELNKKTGELVLTADTPGSGMWDYDGSNEPWHEFRALVRKLVITEHVETIGAFAFYDHMNLTEAEGWEYVKQIRRDAFHGTALTDLVFPEGLVTIGAFAFFNCPAVEVDIPASVMHLEEQSLGIDPKATEKVTFRGNPLMLDGGGWVLALRDSETEERYTVYGLSGSNVEQWCAEFGSPFESIGELADERVLSGACGDNVQWSFEPETGVLTLSGTGSTWDYRGTLAVDQAEREWPQWHTYCPEITKIVIEPGITRLGSSLLADCIYAYAVDCSTVEELGEDVFAGTNLGIEGLSESDMGEAVVSGQCGEHMYYELNKETGVMTLTADEPGSAMWSWSNGTPWHEVRNFIRKLVITENVATIGNSMFEDCRNLSEVEGWESIRQIGGYAFKKTRLKSLVFPEGLVSIGTEAFSACDEVQEIEIPASVEHLEWGALGLDNNSALERLTVKGNPWMAAEGGPGPFDIPESCTVYGLSGSSAEIWYELESIGEAPEPVLSGACGDNVQWSFEPETGVLTLSGTGSTWDYRGMLTVDQAEREWPQWHPYSLEIRKIVVEPGITRLGNSLFYGCSYAYAVECSEELELGEEVFAYTSLSLGVSGSQVLSGQCGDQVFYELNKETGELTLTADTAGSGTWDFDMSDENRPPWYEERVLIRKVTITENVDAVGACAFLDCTNLSEVEGWEYVRQIREGAFSSTCLKELALPEGVVTIASEAFSGCRELRELELPSSVMHIGDYAFGDATRLEKITIKGNTRLIEEWAAVFPLGEEERKNWVLYGLSGSNVEQWCADSGASFESIGDLPEQTLSGQCGDDVRWSFDQEEGVLTLSGTGSTWDYRGMLALDQAEHEWPDWYPFGAQIRRIVVEEGITRLGHNLFADCSSAYAIDCSTEVEVGENVFAGTALGLW